MKGSRLPQPARELDCLFTSDSCLAFHIYLRLSWRCMLRLSDTHLPGPLDLPNETSLSSHSHCSLSPWSLPRTGHRPAVIWVVSSPGFLLSQHAGPFAAAEAPEHGSVWLWCAGCPVVAAAQRPRGVWDLSFPTRDLTRVPCCGRWILNRWLTRAISPSYHSCLPPIHCLDWTAVRVVF